MKKVFLAFISIFIIGCGISSNDCNTSITPPGQSLVGSYELSDISGTWIYGDGVRIFDDTSIVHGTLKLGDNSFDQILSFENDPLGVPTTTYSGTYSVTYTNGTEEGTIGIVTDNMAGTGTFTTSGYNLHIVMSGQAIWTKICDSID